MAKRKRVVARKSGGDDKYSWSVFVDGVEKWDGMCRREAEWRVQVERGKLGIVE